MPFETKTRCTVCRQEVENTSDHDCPESPENVKIREKEHAFWEKRHNEIVAAWGERGPDLKNAKPSVDAEPEEIAYNGKCILTHMGGSSGYEYKSDVLKTPTWYDVIKLFDMAILITDDRHHVFLEGLRKVEMQDDIAILDIIAGS